MMGTRNYRVRNEVVDRISNQESKKERKPTLRGKSESVSSGKHMDSVPKETLASVMTK